MGAQTGGRTGVGEGQGSEGREEREDILKIGYYRANTSCLTRLTHWTVHHWHLPADFPIQCCAASPVPTLL